MPVSSYIIYPSLQKKFQLEQKLSKLDKTELHYDDNKEFFILLTDTSSHAEEKQIQEDLEKIEEIQCLTLAFASDPDQMTELKMTRQNPYPV